MQEIEIQKSVSCPKLGRTVNPEMYCDYTCDYYKGEGFGTIICEYGYKLGSLLADFINQKQFSAFEEDEYAYLVDKKTYLAFKLKKQEFDKLKDKVTYNMQDTHFINDVGVEKGKEMIKEYFDSFNLEECKNVKLTNYGHKGNRILMVDDKITGMKYKYNWLNKLENKEIRAVSKGANEPLWYLKKNRPFAVVMPIRNFGENEEVKALVEKMEL